MLLASFRKHYELLQRQEAWITTLFGLHKYAGKALVLREGRKSLKGNWWGFLDQLCHCKGGHRVHCIIMHVIMFWKACMTYCKLHNFRKSSFLASNILIWCQTFSKERRRNRRRNWQIVSKLAGLGALVCNGNYISCSRADAPRTSNSESEIIQGCC